MLSYTLGKGFDVLKKNKAIFVPFIVLGIISVLSFLLIAKPVFEFTSQSSYSSTAFYTTSAGGYDSYFFKKFADYMLLIIVWATFLSFLAVLANVAGLRAVKDYLRGETTKISDMVKTALTKGFVAIFAVLAANILFFLPGIIGMLLYLFAIGSIASTDSYSTMNLGSAAGMMLIAFIMFIAQAIILLAFGHYILSKKFRKFYTTGIIGAIILLILGIATGFISPVLSLIFLILFFILFIVISFALVFITYIVISAITYILPSVIVLNDNINVTDAIKKTLNFTKDNTANFCLLLVIYIVIMMAASIPSFMFSFANAMHPSFSLYLFAEIFTIVLNIFISPFILSVFALAYAFSLMKEKESEKEDKGITMAEEIKSGQNSGLSGGLDNVR
ncbi:MAG: hypothetical protein CVT88_07480 [Candidatus Altiarchaeales archaeon HGW-Altiarchaeales-1]|nr:MAG: hypothetical protein CVT88_07480 [Candidatus Altiarchaeales archaeon HGW-Altiarchaeales-1]